ncbi:MAG: DUF5658 family protein [Promethearchaeota archaeon]
MAKKKEILDIYSTLETTYKISLNLIFIVFLLDGLDMILTYIALSLGFLESNPLFVPMIYENPYIMLTLFLFDFFLFFPFFVLIYLKTTWPETNRLTYYFSVLFMVMLIFSTSIKIFRNIRTILLIIPFFVQ